MEISDTDKTSQKNNPKTILGFLATVIGILGAATTLLVGILAPNEKLHYLIPYVIGGASAIVVLILVGVFAITWRDPTGLLLGHITGETYIKNRKLTLGDNRTGERTIVVPKPKKSDKIIELTSPQGALPSPKSDDQS